MLVSLIRFCDKSFIKKYFLNLDCLNLKIQIPRFNEMSVTVSQHIVTSQKIRLFTKHCCEGLKCTEISNSKL